MASYNDSGAREVERRACSSGSVDVPKESVLLDVKRAFPLRVYGRW